MSQITPFAEWADDSEDVQLPSGKVVKLRRPDIIELIGEDGEAPDVLGTLVLSSISGKGAGVEIDDLDKLRQVMQSVNTVCKAAFVYPKLWDDDVVEEPYIPVGRVPFNDRSFVFAWVLGVKYQAAQSFRPQPAGDMGTVPAVQNVRPQTKRRNGAKR